MKYTYLYYLSFLNNNESEYNGRTNIINDEKLLIHNIHPQCRHKHGRQCRLRYRKTLSFA